MPMLFERFPNMTLPDPASVRWHGSGFRGPLQSAASTAIGSARGRSVYFVSPSDDTEFLDACERTLIGLSESSNRERRRTLKPSLFNL